jgi:glycosyltransferase A (GT-A) superfamily protein (DUF2064 family)
MKVLVMAKAPVAGAVKTRMCPPLHLSEAAELAAAALADTLQVVASSGAEERLIALDGDPGEWLPPGFTVIAQRGATFAERLENAWAHAGGPTLQIGMDTPQISTELLQRSFATLEDSPGAVLGHAEDGGWWALGLLQAQPGVFRNIPMSTPSTGERQAGRLRELGLGPGLLPPLVDVDEWAHAVAVARQIPTTQFGRCVAGLADRIAQRSLAQGPNAIGRGGLGARAVGEP